MHDFSAQAHALTDNAHSHGVVVINTYNVVGTSTASSLAYADHVIGILLSIVLLGKV